jgi:hypothetical protein
VPAGGLNFSGNNHLIARNRFSCTNHEIVDTGVVYSGRSWINRGSIVGGNIFDDNRASTIRPLHLYGMGVQSVYLDDTLMGNAVVGNIQITGDRFTFMNGGSDNTYAGNVVVNPQYVSPYDASAKKASRIPGLAMLYSAGGCGMATSQRDAMKKDYDDRRARPIWLAAYPEMARPLTFLTPACSYFPNTIDDLAPHNNVFASNLLLSSAPKVDYFEGNTQVPAGAYAMFRNNWPFLGNTARKEAAWASNNAFARQPWTGTTPNILPAIKAVVASYMTQFPTTGVSSATKTGQMLDKARTYLNGAADAYAANAKVWQRMLGPSVNLERLPCDRVGD